MDALASIEMPPDLQLVTLGKLAAAMDLDVRKLRRVVAEAKIPIVALGERRAAIRLSDARWLLAAHEVTS